MSLRRLLVFVVLLSVLVQAAAIPHHNVVALAGEVSAAGERAALATIGVSLPVEAAVSRPAMLACPDFVAKAVVAVLLERVAFRDMRLGQTNFFRQRAAMPVRLRTCS